MKRATLFVTICILLAGLTGCGKKLPDAAVDGTPWSKDWTMVGEKIGVEDPGSDFTLRDVKGAKQFYFTSWSIGDAQPYVGSQGEDGSIYDAQMVFLVSDAGSTEAAQANVDEWLTLAKDTYSVIDTFQQICNGQEFTVLTYTFDSETSSYARGASAFTVYDGCAVSVEFACQDSYEEDAVEVLTEFLEHCHYAA